MVKPAGSSSTTTICIAVGVAIAVIVGSVALGFVIASWSLDTTIHHEDREILRRLSHIESLLKTFDNTTLGDLANISDTLITFDMTTLADFTEVFNVLINEFTIVGLFGEDDTDCADGNVCTADILKVDANYNLYCINPNLVNGVVCNDSCLQSGTGACVGGQCQGQCLGQCEFNVYAESIDEYFRKRDYTDNPNCDPTDAIQIIDFFTNHTSLNLYNLTDPLEPAGPWVNWLVFNTTEPGHKSSLCLMHTCIFFVPVWPPQAFVAPFIGDASIPFFSYSVFDTPGDGTIYDQMCAAILDPNATVNSCFTARLSNIVNLEIDYPTRYSCAYTYRCAEPWVDTNFADPLK